MILSTGRGPSVWVRALSMAKAKLAFSWAPRKPAIGRKTKGGLEITSKPLSDAPTGVGLGSVVTTGSAEGEAEGDSDGLGLGVGDGVALTEKLAHGFGCTLAHSLCTPGPSPGKGLTRVLKLPLPSAWAKPATWLEVSQ